MKTELWSSSRILKKKKMKRDRISNLHDDIIQQILSCLPIRDAVRTRILCRKLKSKCDNLPCLVFDDQCCLWDQASTTFECIVDHVLLFQIGSIHTFKISRKDLAAVDLNRWIYRVSKSSVKKFTLELWRGPPYNVSSSLFLCKNLVHLELYNCVLKLPSTFKGFRTLKILYTQMVTIAQDDFEKMISCSPQLERLILCEFDGIKNLNIDAPKLQYLTVKGDFEDVDIGMNTLNLVHVSIEQQKAAPISCTNLEKFFSQLTLIENLSIEGVFLESSAGALQDELPKPYLSLKVLRLGILWNNMDEIVAAVRILRSSPALKELEISLCQEAEAADANANAGDTTFWLNHMLNDYQNWELTQLRLVKVSGFSGVKAEVDFIKYLLLRSPALQQLEILAQRQYGDVRGEVSSWLDDSQVCAFNQLRVVKASRISGVKAEVELIRFLLLNSPVLEKMILRPLHSSGGCRLLKKLLMFRRASAQAQIEYLHPLKLVHSYSESDSSSPSDSD
ncbi:PREDICTED: F-box/FBD/LRR-repeat protein At1g13570-like [Fragaria vesca subsp. vesca]|uniref:F-box/FBD/LRR-repeat protein At1g13570-like n=1 Tax=Fragaria vesca subsp. vesca TaxID=101020 RepID=UPI0002C34599|nr:PREDICTED: F-box/FBD/LRR-repeat protein At1g13570-like [Fragaria vesca subsp. vesca]